AVRQKAASGQGIVACRWPTTFPTSPHAHSWRLLTRLSNRARATVHRPYRPTGPPHRFAHAHAARLRTGHRSPAATYRGPEQGKTVLGGMLVAPGGGKKVHPKH